MSISNRWESFKQFLFWYLLLLILGPVASGMFWLSVFCLAGWNVEL